MGYVSLPEGISLKKRGGEGRTLGKRERKYFNSKKKNGFLLRGYKSC